MRIDLVSIFPALCEAVLGHSLLARALAEAKITAAAHDLRQWTTDVHRTVDDTPFGGGAGMVLKPEPLVAALEALPRLDGRQVILLSPRGETLTQALVDEFAACPQLVLICGRYEGVDERVRSGGWIDREVSVGDYVLMGGELPALMLVEAVTRKVHGVIGNPESLQEESFGTGWLTADEAADLLGLDRAAAAQLVAGGVLEYPQYTRPREFRGLTVPEVLLSGNHAQISRWRKLQALKLTVERQQRQMRQWRTAADNGPAEAGQGGTT